MLILFVTIINRYCGWFVTGSMLGHGLLGKIGQLSFPYFFYHTVLRNLTQLFVTLLFSWLYPLYTNLFLNLATMRLRAKCIVRMVKLIPLSYAGNTDLLSVWGTSSLEKGLYGVQSLAYLHVVYPVTFINCYKSTICIDFLCYTCFEKFYCTKIHYYTHL